VSARPGRAPRGRAEAGPLPRTDQAGVAPGICCSATAVARRPPRYARAAAQATFDVALRLEDDRTGGTLAYAPTAGAIDAAVQRAASDADLLLFDGTVWSDDELRAVGGGDAPTARG